LVLSPCYFDRYGGKQIQFTKGKNLFFNLKQSR